MRVATLRARISTPTFSGGRRSRVHELLEDHTFEVGTFKRRLLEAIEWSKPRVSIDDPAGCLRTATLRPKGWPPTDRMERHHAEEVFKKRKKAIQRNTAFQPKGLAGGRLLVFFPDYWLYEGVAALESQDFIDFAETPPWDTWVYYGMVSSLTVGKESDEQPTEYLMSWIPEEFLHIVDDALWSMSVASIWWVDDAEPELF